MVVYPLLVNSPRDLVILLLGVAITLILILGLDLLTKFKGWFKNRGKDSGSDVNVSYNSGGEISDIGVVNDDGSVVKIIFNNDDDIVVVSSYGSSFNFIFNSDNEISEVELVSGDGSVVTHIVNSGKIDFGKDIIKGEVEFESVDSNSVGSESVDSDEVAPIIDVLDSDDSSLGLSDEELDEDNKKSSALIQYRDALRQLQAESGKGSGITLEEAAKEDVRLLNMTLEELLTYEPDDVE